MKKVRFQSPGQQFHFGAMEENNYCHSPRPYLEKQADIKVPAVSYDLPRVVEFSNDPMVMFERSNGSPYPTVQKTKVTDCVLDSNWSPSNDLELSMLDIHEPRKPVFHKVYPPMPPTDNRKETPIHPQLPSNENGVLKPVENIKHVIPPNVLNRDDGFFIKPGKLPLELHVNSMIIGKENSPTVSKRDTLQLSNPNPVVKCADNVNVLANNMNNQIPYGTSWGWNPNVLPVHHTALINSNSNRELNTAINPMGPQFPSCPYMAMPICHCVHCSHSTQCVKQCVPPQNVPPNDTSSQASVSKPMNAVDKKKWAIEKFEQAHRVDCMEVEKQTNVSKEKREPTVSDLFKIIKLQNEQLQLLQEKVDKFISNSRQSPQNNQDIPMHNFMAEQMALQTIDKEQHKISIGVMTSFEVVRTSTIINKEVLTQSNDNAQIQCNRSQISVKEVVSKTPANLNFLDGIQPVAKSVQSEPISRKENVVPNTINNNQVDTVPDEKTLNEMSLYNVQVDNATAPLMSPEQSLYLDVRDYSDSESSSDDQSNVGWTYYNKVMTHVNGMLHDCDMPSSASALFRNTRQQCVQMQIDKTNVSVTKRVKFGDDPLGIHQPHIYAASTDTSLKMNQLAAKYLSSAAPARPAPPAPTALARHNNMPIDMSFATRNYMERHKLIQAGVPHPARSPPAGEMPRFLDITALKQQPKFL